MATHTDTHTITLAEIADPDSPCVLMTLPGRIDEGATVPCPHGDHQHTIGAVTHL
jgi:hypothetical protein